MNIEKICKANPEAIDHQLMAVPFFKRVYQYEPCQYELLLSYSRLFHYQAGEIVIEQGRNDHWLYFLLKGQLFVSSDAAEPEDTKLNQITPGEVFGDIGILLERPRTADIVADPNGRPVVVFGTDYSVFGDLCDYARLHLPTKLIYYRNMVHNLRWKLGVYRAEYPSATMADDYRKVRLYFGEKDCETELLDLHRQAVELAKQLVVWNQYFMLCRPQPLNQHFA